MTIAHGHPAQDMHELLLRLLGAFSHLQIIIDDFAKTFFVNRMPIAADVVCKRVISRIKDEERIQLFRAIADDVGSDGDLTNFNQVYSDVKRLRDKAAHAARFQIAGSDTLSVTESYVISGPEPDFRRIELDRMELVEVVQKCRWLEAQILYVMYSSELIQGLSLGDQPIEVVRPARLPGDWDGVVFRNTENPGICTM